MNAYLSCIFLGVVVDEETITLCGEICFGGYVGDLKSSKSLLRDVSILLNLTEFVLLFGGEFMPSFEVSLPESDLGCLGVKRNLVGRGSLGCARFGSGIDVFGLGISLLVLYCRFRNVNSVLLFRDCTFLLLR